MSAQEFLTLLFNAIALAFITIATLDFITGLIPLMPRQKISLVSPGQLSLFDLKSEPLPLLPDPWTLPLDEVTEVVSRRESQHHSPSNPKPLLLLPQADVVAANSLQTTVEQPLDQLLSGVDIEKLQLRRARQIAKTLGIVQKLNGKDQPLSWLRTQIKAHLQLRNELPPEKADAIAKTKAKNVVKDRPSASQTLPKLHKHGIALGDAVRVLLGKGKHSDKITTATSVTAKEIVTPLGTFKPSALIKYVDRSAEIRALGIVPGVIVEASNGTQTKVICTFGDGRVLAEDRYYNYSELTAVKPESAEALEGMVSEVMPYAIAASVEAMLPEI